MKSKNKSRYFIQIILGIIVILILVGCIYPKYKNYREEKAKEEQIAGEEERKQEYISFLKKLRVYTKSGRHSGVYILDKAQKVDDYYIREGYLKVFLRTMYLVGYSEDEVTVEEIYSLYEKESPEIREKFECLKKYYKEGGTECTQDYIDEINAAYDTYFEKYDEKYNGKESYELTAEDYIGLEKWILENSDAEKYPNILRWHESKKEN